MQGIGEILKLISLRKLAFVVLLTAMVLVGLRHPSVSVIFNFSDLPEIAHVPIKYVLAIAMAFLATELIQHGFGFFFPIFRKLFVRPAVKKLDSDSQKILDLMFCLSAGPTDYFSAGSLEQWEWEHIKVSQFDIPRLLAGLEMHKLVEIGDPAEHGITPCWRLTREGQKTGMKIVQGRKGI